MSQVDSERPGLPDLLETAPKILAECAVAERLRRRPGVTLHPTLFNTPLIYGPEPARREMETIYKEYIAVANQAGLPLLLTAPTWRLDKARVTQAGVPVGINHDAVRFLQTLRDASADPGRAPVLVGALIGPQNDCYRPDLAPEAKAAEGFHAPQVAELAASHVDFLLAQTLPSLREALGLARCLSRTDRPWLISFCTGPDGRVLDGTPLPEAMARVDADPLLARPPLGYAVNCTHPQFLLDAYPVGSLERLVGIQANGSSKDVTQLEGATATESDPVDEWAAAMLRLHETHGVPILGGCCGTSLVHLQHLAG